MISMLASKALVTNIHRREWKLMLFRGKDTKLLENICVSAGDFDVLVKSVMNTRTRKKEAPAKGNNPTLLSANQKHWVAAAKGKKQLPLGV